MGSTVRRLKIYYVHNFRMTRHAMWLIAGIALLLMLASRVFDYGPSAFYEVCVFLVITTHAVLSFRNVSYLAKS